MMSWPRRVTGVEETKETPCGRMELRFKGEIAQYGYLLSQSVISNNCLNYKQVSDDSLLQNQQLECI